MEPSSVSFYLVGTFIDHDFAGIYPDHSANSSLFLVAELSLIKIEVSNTEGRQDHIQYLLKAECLHGLFLRATQILSPKCGELLLPMVFLAWAQVTQQDSQEESRLSALSGLGDVGFFSLPWDQKLRSSKFPVPRQWPPE